MKIRVPKYVMAFIASMAAMGRTEYSGKIRLIFFRSKDITPHFSLIFVCYITSLPPIATEKVILSGITGEDCGKTTEDYGILCNTKEDYGILCNTAEGLA